uniref:hypothetical protein n=1 Tax=Legionella tunisiensis TaxID=1034944 RepID=UPI0005943CB9
MGKSLFLLNTATLDNSDLLTILNLAEINQKMDFATEIVKVSSGVAKFLRIAQVYYERDGVCFTFDKFTVKPTNTNKKVEDIPAVRNEIRFVYDEVQVTWHLVTVATSGLRFQKEVNQLTVEDAKQPYLAGLKLAELKTLLKKATLTKSEWDQIKADCFVHSNPLHAMAALLRTTLDKLKNLHTAREIREIRTYFRDKIQKQGITLIIYSNVLNADACGKAESSYVKASVRQAIQPHQQLRVLYIGGGHGWPRKEWDGRGMLSALKAKDIEEICVTLKTKNIRVYGVIVLSSCFSASYANQFSFLSTRNSVMLSSSLSQAGENFFKNAVTVASLQNQLSFFSVIQNHPKPTPTGLCITYKDKHIGLKLCYRKTGLPATSAYDEYVKNNQIVAYLKSKKPESEFSDSLQDCSER